MTHVDAFAIAHFVSMRALAGACATAIALVLQLASAVPEAQADDAGSAVLVVLDASGSMWGRVDERPKIEIARDVLSDVLGTIDPQVQLGLLAYGHRRKNDCADIEVLAPVGSDRSAVRAAVETLSPKGMTPLTAAIERSVEALRSHEGEASVIVVSDGKESCEGDPCAAAAAAARSGVRLRIHVVGFDVGEAEAAQLRCIASEGGGQYFSAASAGELGQALAAVQKVVAAPAAPQPTPTVAASSPAQITFQVVYAEGDETLAKGAVWAVYEAALDIEGKRRRVHHTGADRPTLELEPGSYVVEVRRGDTTTRQQIEVTSGEARVVTVSLDAGLLEATAVTAAGGKPLKGVHWRVYSGDVDMEGNRENVTSTGADEASLTLKAGRYLLEARWGEAKEARDVEVKAGQGTQVEVVLEAGVLRPTAKLAAGQPAAKRVGWTVFRAERDIEGERERVTSSGADEPTFRLPVGRYVIEAYRGEARASTEAEVKAGRGVAVEVVLAAGLVAASAVDAAGHPVERGINWTVLRAEIGADGSRGRVTSSGAAKANFTLPAGDYILRASGRKAGSGETALRVVAGESQSIALRLE